MQQTRKCAVSRAYCSNSARFSLTQHVALAKTPVSVSAKKAYQACSGSPSVLLRAVIQTRCTPSPYNPLHSHQAEHRLAACASTAS